MTNISVKYLVGGIATAAVMGYAHLGHTPVEYPLPSSALKDFSLECCLPSDFYQDTHYSFRTQEVEFQDQIETIHGFISSLLENTQDLDPRISKLVDENFWELG